MSAKPRLSFWQIWNMCFGFLGIQFGFALQNANVSRIFQTLGADLDQIPALWIAAPLTGLLVQPVVGYFSDRTWTRLGRRRPYFLFGALFATLALLAMPNSPALWIAAGLLWILDASINISMEPFRAYVGDQLPPAAASGRLRDAEFLHRRRFGGREPVAVPARASGSREHRGTGRDPATVKIRVLFRRGHAVPRGRLDCGAARANTRLTCCKSFDDAGTVRHTPLEPRGRIVTGRSG